MAKANIRAVGGKCREFPTNRVTSRVNPI